VPIAIRSLLIGLVAALALEIEASRETWASQRGTERAMSRAT
jgi:hypothetical protein